jgi:hypothetical protein
VVNHISLLTGKNAQDQVKTSIAFRALAWVTASKNPAANHITPLKGVYEKYIKLRLDNCK